MNYGEKTPVIRDIIYALDEERQWMKLVRGNGKPYAKLIDFLLNEPVYDEDTPPDVVKNMTVTRYASRLGEKMSTVNKWLRQIYADIFELNEQHPELFVNPGEQMCSMYYYSRTYKSGFTFNLGLRYIPRVGDQIDFYFPQALCDTAVFIVKEVTHKYTHGMARIEITLSREYLFGRSYRSMLIDKARFLNLISIEDEFAPDYVLDQKLKQVFGGNKHEYI